MSSESLCLEEEEDEEEEEKEEEEKEEEERGIKNRETQAKDHHIQSWGSVTRPWCLSSGMPLAAPQTFSPSGTFAPQMV